MFDVGFWEIVVISVLGLLFLGPRRLPQVISKVGHWAGRARAMARGLKVQLEREVRLSEFKDDIGNLKDDVGHLKDDMEDLREEVEDPLSEDFIEAVKSAAKGPADKND